MPITSLEFDVVRKMIYERAAIVLEPGKEYLVEARLGPLARADGCTINQLIGRLRNGTERSLSDRVVEALTTNETAFFRCPGPFLTQLDVEPEATQVVLLRNYFGIMHTREDIASVLRTFLDDPKLAPFVRKRFAEYLTEV